ncbi:glycine oxidase ThiO [Aureliella helgolandensis]|uniref:Glycine oxidase n=1 Tax=Aureliella helgolandensis TaxID=2527968 RepID=A0A518GHF0_9BACT|nr:glycine oxidase ThiO [Aureliella helgolandensis]QDV28004.1 Glycine oxidase [Aureliella helgolandensis]
MSAPPTTDVLIVGSGVIGLSLAWELAQRGLRVRVLESGQVGRATSWAGAGILPPAAKYGANDAYDQLKSLSHALHPDWAARLQEETGIDTGFQKCGGLYLARTRAEAATLVASQFWWQEHGIEFHRWSPEELMRHEPALAALVPQLKSAWFLPEEYQLRNPRHLKALAAACSLAGVELIEETPVDEVLIGPSGVASLRAGDEVFQADQLCLCSGPWARMTLEQMGISTGMMPVRGQIVMYRCQTPPISRVVNEGNRYLVARSDGRILAGSIEEEVGFRIETTSEGIRQIRDWAEGVLPLLQQTPVEKSWAGLRPGSFDGWPYMGKIGTTENLFVAAGHYRAGIHLSCGTAVLMADLMLGHPTSIDLNPFRPGRG